MEVQRLPAGVLAAATDRRGGATEVAAAALDGLLEVADDAALLEEAVAVLLAGQPAMAPMWHVARAARAPDPPAALAELRHRLDTDAEAAVATAAAWLRHRLGEHPGEATPSHGSRADRPAVATVSHSSLVDRVLARAWPPFSVRRPVPRWGSVAHSGEAVPEVSTTPLVGVVGADAIGPGAFLNAEGTAELAGRLPTLVVATAIKLVPAEVFDRLAAPGFEAVPLETVSAVVVGPEVLSPADVGRRAQALRRGRP